ncbi:MAG: Uma2 family endonuclease [Blastocatellia bacterium]|nr:Uma2 family endonuclease [Blastocatellia bacterium]
MMSAQPKHKYTLEEYLEMDRQSEERLEYWDGEIFDMSGASEEHGEIEANLAIYLGRRLKEGGCRIFLANTRLKVPSLPPYRYGDTSASCKQAQFEKIGGVDVLTNSSLVIEILSKSTEAYDRGLKFSHYKSIPSFCEYLLIAQELPHVTHYIKQDERVWNQREYTQLDEVVQLVSVRCEITLRELYESVTFQEIKPRLRPLE